MTEPLVSIVIPAYNAADTLPVAVSSALRQTYGSVEVVVVDDGSEDETSTVVERLSPDVRLIHQPNAGLPVARNAGWRGASGEFIAFLDADDGCHPLRIERQMATLGGDPGLTSVLTGRVRIGPSAAQTRKVDNCGELVSHSVTDLLAMCRRGVGASMLVRREALDAADGFDEASAKRPSGEDELLTRIQVSGAVATLGQPLYWVFESGESMRWRYTADTFAQTHARWLGPWARGDVDALPGIVDTPENRRAARAGLLRRSLWRAYVIGDAAYIDAAARHLGNWGGLTPAERCQIAIARAAVATRPKRPDESALRET
ncbi:MAG TPA: glycosyltransferase family A protein [Armatimonadota bacterium]|jgi:glycosyltransferase involved in cell wall biosynthesis|nr:glycosyltransferase family A protein [Armatimonadota bacterium]